MTLLNAALSSAPPVIAQSKNHALRVVKEEGKHTCEGEGEREREIENLTHTHIHTHTHTHTHTVQL